MAEVSRLAKWQSSVYDSEAFRKACKLSKCAATLVDLQAVRSSEQLTDSVRQLYASEPTTWPSKQTPVAIERMLQSAKLLVGLATVTSDDNVEHKVAGTAAGTAAGSTPNSHSSSTAASTEPRLLGFVMLSGAVDDPLLEDIVVQKTMRGKGWGKV